MLTVSVLSFSAPAAAQIGIGSRCASVRRRCRCMRNRFVRVRGISGRRVIGHGMTGRVLLGSGTWVVGPVGMLWTPGYWGFAGGFYGWHGGYWGPHVGFYGGINYGFGYGGVGFGGGEWRGGAFFYNRSVMNVDVHNVTNVYNRTVVVNNMHTSFNGPGGIEARPTAEEERYSHEQHTAPLASQTEHEHAASQNKQLFASENHGRPAIAATGRPGEFSGHGVTGRKRRERRIASRRCLRRSAWRGQSRRGGQERACQK